MKVFLDTNVLVAAFASRGLCEDLFRTVLTQHQLIVSEAVLTELERILVKKLRIPAPKATAVTMFVRRQARVSDPSQPAPWPISDPDDQWIVAAAIEAGADVLVTGDRHLLDDAAQIPILVISPRGFWEKLR